MMRRNLPIYFFCLMLVMSSPAVQANEIVDQISEHALNEKILTSDDQVKLDALADELDSLEDIDNMVLRRLALTVTQKVENDIGQMRSLILNIERMTKDKYAARIGRVRKSGLRSSRRLLKEVDRKAAEAAPKFNQSTSNLSNKYFIKILKKNIEILIGKSGRVNIPGLWLEVKRMAAEPYLRWNKKYTELSDRLTHAADGNFGPIREHHGPINVLTYEEVKFRKAFHLVQPALRLLSEDTSSLF